MIEQLGNARPDASARSRRERGQVNWDTVAIDYGYAEMTIGAICRKHAISRAELLQRAKAHRWPTQRTQSTDRGSVGPRDVLGYSERCS
jgi:hypothetical protein